MKKIALELTSDEVGILRDAILNEALALRENKRGRQMREEEFLSDPDISDRGKDSYMFLHELADDLEKYK